MNPFLLGALASILATPQVVSGDLRPLELERRIGVVWSPPRQTCAAFRVASAEPGLAVTEVWFPLERDESPVRVDSGRLGARVDECGLWGRPGYLLTYHGPYGAEAVLPHLVIIGRALRPVARRGYLEIDLFEGGKRESLKACTSQEGIHFTVWEGAPLRGRLLHHEYQPLGFNLVPDCAPAEMPPLSLGGSETWIIKSGGSDQGAAQEPTIEPIGPECSAPEYRQFDFWLGEWTVTLPDGKPAGTSRITRILGGCALHESWTSAKPPFRGQSFTTYRRNTKRWHQTWIDNMGGVLLLEGHTLGQAIQLEGSSADSTGQPLRNRIRWSVRSGYCSTVRQFWEISRDGGITWVTEFDGTYSNPKRCP